MSSILDQETQILEDNEQNNNAGANVGKADVEKEDTSEQESSSSEEEEEEEQEEESTTKTQMETREKITDAMKRANLQLLENFQRELWALDGHSDNTFQYQKYKEFPDEFTKTRQNKREREATKDEVISFMIEKVFHLEKSSKKLSDLLCDTRMELADLKRSIKEKKNDC